MRPLAEDLDSLGFWRTHHRSAQLLAVVGGSLVALYGLMTWGGTHRGWIVAIGVLTVLVLTSVMRLIDIDRVVQAPRGALYFYALELSGVALVLTVAGLDGGPWSPLTLLLFPLLVHGLGAYPPTGLALTGGATVAGYLGLHLVWGSPFATTVTATLLVLVTIHIGWLATRNHQAVSRHQAAAARAMRRLAEEDSLTGLASRRATYERLAAAATAARPQRPTSLLALDLDGFKGINDRHGHLAGDEVLRRLADVLRGTSRAGDLVGRLGGDEFLVILPRTGSGEALPLAARIHLAVAAVELPTRVSIGVATCDTATSADELLGRADAALYRAKQAGGGRTEVAPTTVSS
jgi:diguanylate cyclase (GGDEF)-like protein